MNANKLFSEFSIKKIWDKLLQHDKAMSSTILLLSSGNWIEQTDGTFKNTVSYKGFTENDRLTVDLYDDGTISETQLNEYEQYIDSFEIIGGALVATANTKPTQTLTIVVKGEFEMVLNVGDSLDVTGQLININSLVEKNSSDISELNTRVEEVFQLGANRKAQIISSLKNANLGLTEDSTWEDILIGLDTFFPGQFNLLTNFEESDWTQTGTGGSATISSGKVVINSNNGKNITLTSKQFLITSYKTLSYNTVFEHLDSSYWQGFKAEIQFADGTSQSLEGSGSIDISDKTGYATVILSTSSGYSDYFGRYSYGQVTATVLTFYA